MFLKGIVTHSPYTVIKITVIESMLAGKKIGSVRKLANEVFLVNFLKRNYLSSFILAWKNSGLNKLQL